MAGFHILVYGTTADDYVVTDSAYFPVQAINRHKIEFKLTQIKDHTMDTVSSCSHLSSSSPRTKDTKSLFQSHSIPKMLTTQAVRFLLSLILKLNKRLVNDDLMMI